MGRHKSIWIPIYRGPAPALGGFFVGTTLVVALLWVDFPKSTILCRDVNLDLHKHNRLAITPVV